MGTTSNIYFVLVFCAFNLPILAVAACVPFIDQLGQTLKEKSPLGGTTDATSYSRVTGALGAVAVTGFFWAIGNVILLKSLTNINEIHTIIEATYRFFLIGCALFMPYAFNQLKSIFPGNSAAVAASLAQTKAALPAGFSPTIQTLNLTIVNLCNTIDSATLASALDAIKIQVARDFAPEWGIAANLTGKSVHFAGKIQVDTATDAIIYLADSTADPFSGAAGLAGYHAQNHADVPYGVVYRDVCKAFNEPWSCTLSHEILELLADPTAAMTVAGPGPDASTVSYHLEVCDATNGDSYTINGVAVSNFVTRRYFNLVGPSPCTNQLRLTLDPFGTRPGGYMQYDDSTGVNEIRGSQFDPARVSTRTSLRRVRRNSRRALRFGHPGPTL